MANLLFRKLICNSYWLKISIFASNLLQMKRFLGFLVFTFLINSCDDGDISIKTISFDDVVASKCDTKDIIYKQKNNEILLLELPSSTFINDATPANTPIVVELGGTKKVTYRSYDGTVSALNNICANIPAATPNVVEEWTATSGTVQITTTPILVPNTSINAENATKISKYQHYIVFKNITFNKPDGIQLYETFTFGNYFTTATTLPFAFDDQAEKCTSSNLVYNYSGSEALFLELSPTLLSNTLGVQSTVISTTNKVTYRLFASGLNTNYFCTSPTPSTPVLSEQWNAKDGVTGVSGIIEVTTTAEGSGFKHTIRLKKVTFKKGNSEFYLGDDYLFGSYTN